MMLLVLVRCRAQRGERGVGGLRRRALRAPGLQPRDLLGFDGEIDGVDVFSPASSGEGSASVKQLTPTILSVAAFDRLECGGG